MDAPAHALHHEHERVVLVLGGERKAEGALLEDVAGAEQERVLATGAEGQLLDVEGFDGCGLRERRRSDERADQEGGSMVHEKLGEREDCTERRSHGQHQGLF